LEVGAARGALELKASPSQAPTRAGAGVAAPANRSAAPLVADPGAAGVLPAEALGAVGEPRRTREAARWSPWLLPLMTGLPLAIWGVGNLRPSGWSVLWFGGGWEDVPHVGHVYIALGALLVVLAGLAYLSGGARWTRVIGRVFGVAVLYFVAAVFTDAVRESGELWRAGGVLWADRCRRDRPGARRVGAAAPPGVDGDRVGVGRGQRCTVLVPRVPDRWLLVAGRLGDVGITPISHDLGGRGGGRLAAGRCGGARRGRLVAVPVR